MLQRYLIQGVGCITGITFIKYAQRWKIGKPNNGRNLAKKWI